MPKVITTNPRNLTQGHCWAPTTPQTGSTDVFVENFPVVRVGDPYVDHVLGCTPIPSTHSVVPMMGSNNVYVNGRPLVRDGDPMLCGDVADGGAFTVYANGGGTGLEEDPGNTVGYGVGIPVIVYPTNLIRLYYLLGNKEEFIGCPVNISPLEIYTPLTEEDTGRVYKNYPGPPLTQQSGANIPYNSDRRAPIPITISLGEGSQTPNGIRVNPDGSITGALTSSYYTSDRIRIVASNPFSTRTIEIGIRIQKVFNRCI